MWLTRNFGYYKHRSQYSKENGRIRRNCGMRLVFRDKIFQRSLPSWRIFRRFGKSRLLTNTGTFNSFILILTGLPKKKSGDFLNTGKIIRSTACLRNLNRNESRRLQFKTDNSFRQSRFIRRIEGNSSPCLLIAGKKLSV